MTQVLSDTNSAAQEAARNALTKGPQVYYIPCLLENGKRSWVYCDRSTSTVIPGAALPPGVSDPLDHVPNKKLPSIPYILSPDGLMLVPSNLTVQAILEACSNAQMGADGWQKNDTGNGISYNHHTKAGDTWVELRSKASQEDEPDETALKSLWEKVESLSDKDADVFLAMLAQAITSTPDEDGFCWITAQHILDYRGLTPRMQRNEPGGKKRRAGHRQEDIAEIAACVERLSDLWIKIQQWIGEPVTAQSRGRSKGKKAKFTHAARAIVVEEAIFQHQLLTDTSERQTSVAIAWRFKPGTWIKPFLEEPNRQTAWIMQTTLNYDPHNQMWEKRLARYFTFHMRINASRGGATLRRKIGDLIKELSLPLDERHPERTRQRMEQAMQCLVTDKIIDAWAYHKDNPELPARKWLDCWLSGAIEVHAAPATNERYSAIAEKAKQKEARASALKNTSRKKSQQKRG